MTRRLNVRFGNFGDTLMEDNLYLLFPTPIVRIPATEDNYNQSQIEVKRAIEDIEASGDTSTVTYNYGAKKDTPIGAKTYDFIEKYKCKNLKERITDATYKYLDKISWSGSRTFEIRNSWINIADPDEDNTQHCHPGYTISGTYYFRVNEKQGVICFHNPNVVTHAGNFPQGTVCPQTTNIVPDDGDILLFPSWLTHSVKKNRSQEQRISVAFNIDIVSDDSIAFGLIKQNAVPQHPTIHSTKTIIQELKNEN
jgi:uncharacterized protein (TIGR02466 family)